MNLENLDRPKDAAKLADAVCADMNKMFRTIADKLQAALLHGDTEEMLRIIELLRKGI